MNKYCNNIANQFWNLKMTHISQRPFCTLSSTMQSIKDKKLNNSWSWVISLKLSRNATSTHKQCTIDALFKLVLTPSILESTSKCNNSCQKSAVIHSEKLEINPETWSESFWHKDTSEDNNKRKSPKTRYCHITCISTLT